MQDDADLSVAGPNRKAAQVSERLKMAVRDAGGAAAVATRAAIPLRTLHTYTAGSDLKTSALIALADACGVSVEWLATGKEHKLPGEAAEVTIHQTATGHTEAHPMRRAMPRGLFETVDVAGLAQAMDYIERRLAPGTTTLERARAIVLAYDLIVDRGAKMDGSSSYSERDE